jgi:hypothetical protein
MLLNVLTRNGLIYGLGYRKIYSVNSIHNNKLKDKNICRNLEN